MLMVKTLPVCISPLARLFERVLKKMKVENRVISNLFKKLWFKILMVILLCFAMLVFVLELDSTEKVGKHASLEKFTAHLDKRIPALMKSYNIPGVNIALIKKGETVLLKSYGFADLKTGRNMTPDTYCRVESISKSVTAWGVLKLVEKGIIELDKPVVLYLKNWRFPKSGFSEGKVTVRQLLSHTAGLPLGTIGVRYAPESEIPSLEESLSKDAVLRQEPGQSFFYSNAGFNVLELLIQEVTGRDFAEYMKNEVLLPLGMRHSTFIWSNNLQPAVPFGYDLRGRPVQVYVYPDKASGGLFATVEDISTFVTAGMTGFTSRGQKVLNIQSIHQLYSQMLKIPGFYGLAFDSYGLGHFIEKLPNGKKAVSHGGQGSGWMTHFHSVPETGDGIVILTNSQRSWPFFATVLNDWAEWNGFSSVGMGRINQGQKALRAFIVLLLFVSLWQMWRLGQGLYSGRRRFAFLTKKCIILRLTQGSISVLLASGLFWTMNQDYFFLSAVFPTAYVWLEFSIFLFAVILMLSALFPCIKDKMKNR